MVTKPSTMYSTNPKMDTSGITSKSKEAVSVTGGMLYKSALMGQKDFNKTRTITRPEVLRDAAKLMKKGVVVVCR